MYIDVDKISKDDLSLLKENISEEIVRRKNEVYKTYVIEDFYDSTFDEINNLFTEYGVLNNEIVANKIYEYIKSINDFSSILVLFKNSSDRLRESVNVYIDELNEKILLEKSANERIIVSLEEQLEFIDRFIFLLYGNEELSIANLKEIEDFVLSLDIDDDNKFELSFKISNILIERNKEVRERSISSFEENLDRVMELENEQVLDNSDVEVVDDNSNNFVLDNDSNLAIVKEYMKNYRYLFNECSIFSIDDLYNFFDEESKLKENLDLLSIDKLEFVMVLSSILYKIMNCTDDNRLEKYRLYLEKIDHNFGYTTGDKYNELIDELNRNINIVLDELSKCYACSYGGKEDYFEKLNDLQKTVLDVKREVDENLLSVGRFNELVENLNNIFREINLLEEGNLQNSNMTVNNNMIPIKSFVLFDYYDNGKEFVPYVVSDLNPKSKSNLIDNSFDRGQLGCGFKDFEELINDLILLGEPRYIEASSSSISSNQGKIVNRVYYDNNNEKETGILRIRPRNNSILRFFEQKVMIKPGTKVFEQIKNIILKYLPNVQISDDEEFGIFINYASCFKMADEGLYDVAISRRDKKKSYLVQTFVDNFKNKTEFSDEECKMFEQMVILTLNAYEDLRKNNDNFSFSIIDSMGGVQPNAR